MTIQELRWLGIDVDEPLPDDDDIQYITDEPNFEDK